MRDLKKLEKSNLVSPNDIRVLVNAHCKEVDGKVAKIEENRVSNGIVLIGSVEVGRIAVVLLRSGERAHDLLDKYTYCS